MLRLRRRTKKNISSFLVLFVTATVLAWSIISITDVIIRTYEVVRLR
jgi:hypothetical protein